MADFSQITIIGNVGRPPELRETNGGVPVMDFTLGARPLGQKQTLWYKVTVWGEEAVRIYENVEKGDRLLVQGTPMLDVWRDPRSGEARAQICLQTGTVLYDQ